MAVTRIMTFVDLSSWLRFLLNTMSNMKPSMPKADNLARIADQLAALWTTS